MDLLVPVNLELGAIPESEAESKPWEKSAEGIGAMSWQRGTEEAGRQRPQALIIRRNGCVDP